MTDLPSCLLEISPPPKKLFTKGRVLEKDFIGIAMVGTRRPTPQGMALAKSIANRIGKIGIPIISGLADGIDTAAHEGCLEAGGRTVAVLGGGLDRIYPSRNEGLSRKIILEGGSVISEYPEGVPPLKHHFLERNRIVAGLSSAVIVIEAPERSGSISTAGHAAEFGREVLVFPGPVSHSNYRGSHALIRDGARLVSSIEDIFEDLRIKEVNRQLSVPGMSNEASIIMKTLSLSVEPMTVDKLVFLTKLEPRSISAVITELSLEGLVIGSNEGYSVHPGL
ncbi:MAG: DNA-processing protein DprA [Candidatus Colwellbacteria bacterium]|nr:DNA-processing protein DprA [Candidatus Colwellbacteria bacterium]